jgi:histidinol-phosphatase (PHP family)
MPIKENFHTHTYRCKHAKGDVEDYVREAVKHDLEIIGISDHTALPDDRWHHIRMLFEELDGYVDAIDRAKIEFPQIKVLKAMECEYDDEYHAFYKENLLDERKFDYLIGAAHFIPFENNWQSAHKLEPKHISSYAKYFIKSMESGLFAFMAHPDVFGYLYPQWDDHCTGCAHDIFSAAQDLKMPLEINGLGMRKKMVPSPNGLRPPYPLKEFWEIGSEYNVQVVCNSDAHRPEDIIANIDDAKSIAKKHGLLNMNTSKLIKQAYLNKN